MLRSFADSSGRLYRGTVLQCEYQRDEGAPHREEVLWRKHSYINIIPLALGVNDIL